MKKKLILYCVVLVFSCQVVPVMAISSSQENAISDHCNGIKDSLKSVQKRDAKARVYLGGYYENILTNFVMPLNVRLVENNLSNASLVENQNKIADTKTLFMDDYISYQQNLEELIMIDCKTNQEEFYNKLVKVRQKRKIVEQDTLKMRSLLSEHVKLANQVKGKL